MPAPSNLPIHEAIPALKAALMAREAAVLVAPPGAGKTTVVPLALMGEPWVAGRTLILLEPRRLAARAAAARMAATLSERVGETVGFRVRMESRVSAATRIMVVTEGVFTRMILDDPGLDGVAAVLFDEFHERSLDADLGLALARDAQGLVREDLRILVMSATLDGARVSALIGDAPVVESLGRTFPVETRYLGRDPSERLETQAAKAVRRALAEETGGVLVFLPGQGEIRRTADLLADHLPPTVDLDPLYGALTPAEQDRAIAPAPLGRRKVVLATSIAETSLTLEGVRVVVDAGLSRVPRFEPSSGLTRLETVRVSRASADQRRGRAGRTEPGVCYRLWEEAETRALVPFDRPEILEADLAGLALDLAVWGAASPEGLAFMDPPPETAWREARALLHALGALDGEGRLTAHGRRLADLPLPPRLAHMVAVGADAGAGRLAACIALLLTEPGLGGRSVDLEDRLVGLSRDRSERVRQGEQLAARWARSAGGGHDVATPGLSVGALLLAAYPERAARRRGQPGEFRLTTGRAVFVDPTDAIAASDWIVAADLGGGGARDRVLLAARIDEAEVLDGLHDRIRTETAVDIAADGRASAWERRHVDRLMVSERRIEAPSPALMARAQLDRLRREGLDRLPWSDATLGFRDRVAFLRALQGGEWPDLSDTALAARLEDWLEPLLLGRSLDKLTPSELDQAVRSLLPYDLQRRLDSLAPPRFTGPTGDSFAIDYAAEGGPRAEVRVQALYGLTTHPMLAGRVPLTLALTSPAHRPVQVTNDLPGFWRGSWRAVRTEMKGRYPRHPWPEDPTTAPPTLKAKPRGT